MGDDHNAESSTTAHQSEFHFVDVMIPILNPAGVLATGTLDAATVSSLLRALPAGTWELVTHPGYNDGDLAQAHTRLLASRETEREALSALRSVTGARLISFADVARH